jgi:hypothetical protein
MNGTLELCLLQKKGDLMVCKNYTGVMLFNIVNKVLSDILIVFPYKETITGNYQCGSSHVCTIWNTATIAPVPNSYDPSIHPTFLPRHLLGGK